MEEKNKNNHWAIFSGQNLNYDAQQFLGTKLKAIFGGLELDLTNAKIENNAEIKVCALFGGIDIKVPKDVAVIVKSTSIFGGVENKVKLNNSNSEKNIYVKATCIFGGCDILQ